MAGGNFNPRVQSPGGSSALPAIRLVGNHGCRGSHISPVIRVPAASADDKPCKTAGFLSPHVPIFVLRVNNAPCSDAVCANQVCGVLVDDTEAGIEDDKPGVDYILDDEVCP